MYVRLAFAVAAHLEPEILIIDEVLAVGDAEFQKKCLGKMKEVAGEGRTVIFVSHDMNAISSLCRSCVFLKNGEIEFSGTPSEVINRYLHDQKTTSRSWDSKHNNNNNNKEVFIKSAKVEMTGSQPSLNINIKVEVESRISMLQSFIAFNIINGSGQMIGQSIPELKPFIQISNSSKEYNFIINIDGFVPDCYFISIWIGPHFSHTYDWKQEVLQFQVIDSPQNGRTFPHSKEHGAIVPNSKLITE
jgi:lipopolysaccharide transport system ATP-binding protein